MDEPERPKLTEEQRAKISEGMRKSHARRKKAGTGQEKAPVHWGGILRRLIEERDALDIMIDGLRKRGVS